MNYFDHRSHILLCGFWTGITTDPAKTDTVKDLPIPRNIKQEYVGYYRGFVKDCSKIVEPPNSLLNGHGTNKKQTTGKTKPKAIFALIGNGMSHSKIF